MKCPKVNKELLPIKLQYFFISAGIAFLPTFSAILRGKGLSAEAVGLIWTVTPIASATFNLTCGTIADRFKLHRALLIITCLISGLALTSFFYLPDMPFIEAQSSNHLYAVQCYSNDTSIVLFERQSIVNGSYNNLHSECFLNGTFKYGGECTLECKPDYSSKTKSGKTISVNKIGTCESNNIYYLSTTGHQEYNCSRGNCLFEISDNSVALNEFLNCSRTTYMECENSCDSHQVYEELELKQYFAIPEFWLVSICIIVSFCTVHASFTLTDTLCTVMLGEARHKFGQQKLFGSMGIGLTGLLGGLLVNYYSQGTEKVNYTPAIIITVSCNVLTVLISTKINVEVPGKQAGSSGLGKVVRSFMFILLMVTVIIMGITFGVILTFQFIYIQDVAFGWDPNFKDLKLLQGLILFTDCFVGEIPFLFFSALIIKKLGSVYTFSLNMAATSIRLLIYFVVSNPWLFLPVHLLHGLSFGVFIGNMITYASLLAPKGAQATLQSTTMAGFTLGRSLGSFCGGVLYEYVGGPKLFLLLGLFISTYTIIYTLIGCLYANKKCKETFEDNDRGEYVNPNKIEKAESITHKRVSQIEEYVYESQTKINAL